MSKYDELVKEFMDELAPLYKGVTGVEPEVNPTSNMELFYGYSHIWSENLMKEIKEKLEKKPNRFAKIKEHAKEHKVFRQPAILLVYYWADTVAIQTRHITPMPDETLKLVYDDLGLSQIFVDFAKKYA